MDRIWISPTSAGTVWWGRRANHEDHLYGGHGGVPWSAASQPSFPSLSACIIPTLSTCQAGLGDKLQRAGLDRTLTTRWLLVEHVPCADGIRGYRNQKQTEGQQTGCNALRIEN